MKRNRSSAGAGLAALCGLILSACSSFTGETTGTIPSASAQVPSASNTSFAQRMNAMFFGKPAESGPASGPADELECPSVTVRAGASTLSSYAQPKEPTPTTLRYQVTIAQTARECAPLGATLTMKIGMEGRIILGPAGAAGKVDVPIRYALVKEGPQPKTLLTKLHRLPVTVNAGQSNVSFVHVEEDMTIPMPPKDEIEAYVVYVGFDPAPPQTREKPKKSAPSR
ncbi:MAG TPA: hypothetical protein VET25_02795 [Aestuariivirgaceae bacterium]|nr:hypothetical protein [Aestuariivirgaceae bacterium]